MMMMTEKEKAKKGWLYDANNDTTLLKEMEYASGVLFEYNQLSPLLANERREILERLLKRIGKNATIRSPFFCDYGYNIEIGDHFFSNVNLVILDGAKVKIGNQVFIAPNVGIYTAGHPLDAEQRNSGLEYALPVSIGNNVWVGAHVAILPGVSIGDNSVIGAGSVVNKSIPANVLAVGNPCRVIREMTEEDKEKYERGSF